MNSWTSFRATRRAVLAVLALGATCIDGAVAQNLVEGQNYLRLKNPQPVDSGSKIEVLYFFSLGCPHCRDFDPELQKWKRTLGTDVEFKRVPVDFGREQWANLGRVAHASMMVDAMAERSTSASSWLANTTATFFFLSVFNQSCICAEKNASLRKSQASSSTSMVGRPSNRFSNARNSTPRTAPAASGRRSTSSISNACTGP